MDARFDFSIKVTKANSKSKPHVVSCIEKICKTCGKTFYVKPWYGKGMFCSKECADIAKIVNHTPNVTCAYCGKSFYKKPSQIARNKVHCCSKECMGNLRRIIYAGKNNPNYNNFKERIITRDIKGNIYYEIPVQNHPFGHIAKSKHMLYYREHRYIIEQNYKLFDSKYFVIIDGKHYLNPKVDVHHKNEDTTDNRIENLIPLTRSEHVTEHNNRKEIIRDAKTGRITGVRKRSELLENHIANDNQQPSIDRNIDEGSTTNGRVLTDNAEDSNADTSAPPSNITSDDIV